MAFQAVWLPGHFHPTLSLKRLPTPLFKRGFFHRNVDGVDMQRPKAREEVALEAGPSLQKFGSRKALSKAPAYHM